MTIGLSPIRCSLISADDGSGQKWFLHERIATERALFRWRSRSCKCLGGIEHQAIHMSWILATLQCCCNFLSPKVAVPLHHHLIPSGPAGHGGRIPTSSAGFLPNHTDDDGASRLCRCGVDSCRERRFGQSVASTLTQGKFMTNKELTSSRPPSPPAAL